MTVQYLSEEHLDPIFELLTKRYERVEEVPQYRSERTGFDKLCGILQQVQSDIYYPTLLEKAVFVLVAVNKGHFFSNGNKRLALVSMSTFLRLNNVRLKIADKTIYKDLLAGLFPEYHLWEDHEDFTSTDFATYNLSIMIADSGVHHITHDELKMRLRTFLQESVEKM